MTPLASRRVPPTRLASTIAVAVALFLSACSSSYSSSGAPANIAGAYNGNITNGQSTCPGNWQTGQTAQVTITAVQSGGTVSLDVTGGAGLYVQLALGASTFNGTVTGDSVDATLHGKNSQTAGNCDYTWSATFDGQLSGDTLSGTVTYAPVTNGASDCDAKQITGCSEVQTFNGVRTANAPTGDSGAAD